MKPEGSMQLAALVASIMRLITMHLRMNLLVKSHVEEFWTDPSAIKEITALSIDMGPIHFFLKAAHHHSPPPP